MSSLRRNGKLDCEPVLRGYGLVAPLRVYCFNVCIAETGTIFLACSIRRFLV